MVKCGLFVRLFSHEIWSMYIHGAHMTISLDYMNSILHSCTYNIFRFFRQFLVFFALHQSALSLFRFVGALGRTQVVAGTFATFTILIVFVLGGFIVAKG